MGTNSYIAKLKLRLDQAIIQREHWKQLAHKRNYIEVSETDPESRTESVWRVDADAVRRMWAQIRHMEAALTEGDAPQPGPDVRSLLSADDVRDACANAVSVFAEEANADQCREVAEYMREVLLAQIARRQAQRQ